MKNQLPIITFFLLTNLAFAQNGTVTGTVTDNDQTPLLGVNVSIKNTTEGTQTDENGIFEITHLENGNYALSFSYLGFKTKEVSASISNNENQKLEPIILYEGNEILSEVVVEGERRNKFSRKKTAYVSKLPLKDIENTQVYSTITDELLKSQVVVNFDDALKNATGVQQLWASTGRGGDGAGYYALRGFSSATPIGKRFARINKWYHKPSKYRTY